MVSIEAAEPAAAGDARVKTQRKYRVKTHVSCKMLRAVDLFLKE